MPSLSADQLTANRLMEQLRETTCRLRLRLDGLLTLSGAITGSVRAPTPQEMAGMLSELMQAGECLRARPRESDPALSSELAEYRRQVERLRVVLPSIHRALLEERARLEQKRERVKSAAEWAHLSRQTL